MAANGGPCARLPQASASTGRCPVWLPRNWPDWLETLGVHAQPADIEAVGTGTGFLFQGEALGRLSMKLRVRIETTETGIMAALTWDG